MTRAATKLRRCPQCGRKPRAQVGYRSTRSGAQRIYGIHCPNINCPGYAQSSADTAEEAIAAWNRRATHYSDEFGDDVQRSLDEDTLPLFRESRFEIVDWAKNNMDWSDFGDTPVKLKDAKPTDWNEHYMNAASSFDDEDDPEVAS